MIKILVTTTTSSHCPARTDNSAIPNARPPAESVPIPRFSPLLKVAPAHRIIILDPITKQIMVKEHRSSRFRVLKRQNNIKIHNRMTIKQELTKDGPINIISTTLITTKTKDFSYPTLPKRQSTIRFEEQVKI